MRLEASMNADKMRQPAGCSPPSFRHKPVTTYALPHGSPGMASRLHRRPHEHHGLCFMQFDVLMILAHLRLSPPVDYGKARTDPENHPFYTKSCQASSSEISCSPKVSSGPFRAPKSPFHDREAVVHDDPFESSAASEPTRPIFLGPYPPGRQSP